MPVIGWPWWLKGLLFWPELIVVAVVAALMMVWRWSRWRYQAAR